MPLQYYSFAVFIHSLHSVETSVAIVASLFGYAASSPFSFSAAAATMTTPSAAVAPQPTGFTLAGAQTTTSGFTFGSTATLGAQPQTANTQTSAALPAFSLPTTAAGTGQPGGFQFGAVQSSAVSAAAAPSFGLGVGLQTTSAVGVTSTSGFTFSAVPASGTGLTGLLGAGGQTGPSSLFAGAKPGLFIML